MRLRARLRLSGRGCGTKLGMTDTQRSQHARQLVSEALVAHADRLRSFVRARAPQEDVDDVLQLGALRAVERAETLDDHARVVPWIYTIHRNLITDLFRQQASAARVVDATVDVPDVPDTPGAPGPGAEVDARCDCSVIQAKSLSPNYASVLDLVDVRGASLTEAASALGITVNNATVRLHRARRALRDAMLEHCGVQSARDCLDCRCVSDGCCAG